MAGARTARATLDVSAPTGARPPAAGSGAERGAELAAISHFGFALGSVAPGAGALGFAGAAAAPHLAVTTVV